MHTHFTSLVSSHLALSFFFAAVLLVGLAVLTREIVGGFADAGEARRARRAREIRMAAAHDTNPWLFATRR